MPVSAYKTHVRTFSGATILLKRRIFEKNGLFDETLLHKEDKEYWCRLFGEKMDSPHPRTTRFHLKKWIAFCRIHKGSRTASPEHEYWKEKFAQALRKRRRVINASNTRMLPKRV